MMVILFFVLHWQLSVFFQSFFLHRYGAHRQFSLTRGWERFFYLCTWFTQGTSFLVPRAYAVLHRQHHAFADTERDPHSPLFFKNVFAMMWNTKGRYEDLVNGRVVPQARFDGGAPAWELLDRVGGSWPVRLGFALGYVAFYWHFATQAWMWALLPAHFLMGPIHGAIVNWCGHRYGYRNYSTTDVSRNTLFFDFLTMGELFQNNHHRFGMSPNFAARRFEVDPAWLAIRAMSALGILHLETTQRMRWPEPSHESEAREQARVVRPSSPLSTPQGSSTPLGHAHPGHTPA